MIVKKIKNNKVIIHKSLSIQFSLDGFSFSVSNAANKNEIVAFTRYTFKEKLATPEELLEKIKLIFSINIDLHEDFDTITVIHQNELATLVPEVFFDESKLKNYLDFNIKTLANDYVTFDNLPVINAKNVYIPYININNYFFQNFGEFEYKHHATILINKLTHYTRNNTKKQFFVNVNPSSLDIIVTQAAKLIMYNSFQFTTKEDFIYYILFVAEQLQLHPYNFQLTFLGDIEESSELYKIAYEYVRDINFIETTSNLFATSNDFCNHSNYILAS